MRLNKVVSKNAIQYYVIESTYVHGRRSTTIVEKLGTYAELSKKYEDPDKWAKEYIAELNKKQAQLREELNAGGTISIDFNASTKLPKDQRSTFNGGYLFIQDIFYKLGLDDICKNISDKTKTEYDLTDILSRLIYSRILDPGSKARTFEFSQTLIETSSFKQHDIYRALSLLAQNSDYIQSEVYKNSLSLGKRSDEILYYDCTNYYFEIEQEDSFRKYGKAKSNKPNPIVGMGLFMDADGIPIAFSMFPGNTNEQGTLTPLEEKIEKDFGHSKFIVCTDAGLSSKTNKLFNSKKDKAFITTQSIKKMSKDMQEWALAPTGWKLVGSSDKTEYNINEIDSTKGSEYYDSLFYKEKKFIEEVDITDKNGNKTKEYIDETIYITYSLKYKDYLSLIRNGQIERAKRLIEESVKKDGTLKKSKAKKRYSQTDYHRFIESVNVDMTTGEVLPEILLTLRRDLIDQEEKYDGFYGVASNLTEDVEQILDINKKRWQIETCFRTIKQEFDAEPVYLSREDRIKAHFLVCVLSLIIFRYLEKQIASDVKSYTIQQIIKVLKEMNFKAVSGYGYIPTYTRNELTDRLHQVFGFNTSVEIVPQKNMKNIIKKTKQKNITH